jgi:hypothetical protein
MEYEGDQPMEYEGDQPMGYEDVQMEYEEQSPTFNMQDLPKKHMFVAIGAMFLFVIVMRKALKAGGNECGRGWFALMLLPVLVMLWYSFILKVYVNYRRSVSPMTFPAIGDIISQVKTMKKQGMKVSPAGAIEAIMGSVNFYVPNVWIVIGAFTVMLILVQFMVSSTLMLKHLPGRPKGEILKKAFSSSFWSMFVCGIITTAILFVGKMVLPKIKFPPIMFAGYAIDIATTVQPFTALGFFFPHTMIIALAAYGIGCEVVKKIPVQK